MSKDLVLQKLDTARAALAEAKTIQETKKILDVAAAAEILAKRQKLGVEAITYATAIKVEALAQLGRMLKEMPKNHGANGTIVTGTRRVPVTDDTPTLTELGLDKKTSKLAQDVAALPDEELEKVKQGVASLSQAQKSIREKKRIEVRQDMADKAKHTLVSLKWQVHHGDMQTLELDRQFDFIITDMRRSQNALMRGVATESAQR